MKIAIDINELTLNQNTGVKVYTREIVNALGRVDKKNEYILYCCRDTKFCVQKGIKFYAPTNKNFKLKTARSALPFWTYFKLPREIKKDKPDVLFMPIQATPFFRKPKNLKLVVTVHDLAFLLFPKHFTFKDRFLLNFHTKRAVKMADKIIAPSKATKNDIIKFYGVDENKIEVIYHGIKNQESGIKNQELRIKNPYILFVGTIQPRKNIIRLIEAFEILKNPPNPLFKRGNFAPPFKKGAGGIKLIIAGGRGWLADEIYKRAKESEFSDDIEFVGSVSDNKLADLYKNATIFVLPSLYEGFGLPVLEAMSYGIPCVISDNSSLSEISGSSEQACLFTTGDSNDIAEKINVLLNDEKLRRDLSEEGIENAKRFSWTKAAKKTLEVFKK